jgi:hypothetical protein
MANVRIAQIKGGFTNYLKDNPSFLTAFFANYPSGLNYSAGSGVPTSTPALNSMYFDYANGDIYQYLLINGSNQWQYQCNYFDTKTSRIVSKQVLFSDLNSGSSPKTQQDILLPLLGKGEYISDVFMQINSNWAGANIGDFSAILRNLTTNNAISTDLALQGFLDITSQENAATKLTLNGVYITFFPNLSGTNSLVIRFTSTDLTTLTAGSLTMFFKIETLL